MVNGSTVALDKICLYLSDLLIELMSVCLYAFHAMVVVYL